ncbi:DUF302 domain-containing protein [Marinobacter sp. CAU 1620]|nr:DUF302 domain-containing protein [Marinobacter arenosus]MBW0147988.1 DUF302 domain-containing protein [Marinobacter arenosus]
MKMLRLFAAALFTLATAGLTHAADGLIAVKSSYSVPATADKLVAALEEKGMRVMNRIDHAAGAEAAGSYLRPTELVIFGNPTVGTPLMRCAQSVAADLPQKALIWEDEDGQVWLGYNDPAYLKARHGIEGCDEVLANITGALARFAEAATR